MSLPRIIYLSNTPLGKTVLRYLQGMRCQVVMANTENLHITEFPEYDLGIGFLYSHKIPESEFKIPYRWVNFHPAPLPEYRGRNLAYHAIMKENEAKEFGATVHYMDKDFDTGEIIKVSRFPVEPHYTAGDLVRLAHGELVDLFVRYMPSILKGKVPSTPQVYGEGCYYYKAFICEEIHLNWYQAKRVRACTVHPIHHAHVVIGGVKYKLIPEEVI